MITEILKAKYSTDWNLCDFLNTPDIKNIIQENYPLVVSTFSGQISINNSHHDLFVHNRRKGKPSELRGSSQDSLVSFAAEALGVTREVLKLHAECSSSIYSLYIATLLSKENNCPVIVFCADNLGFNDFEVWRFKSFGALDQSSGRPFDKSSKGFRFGTGMAIMIVKHSEVYHHSPVIGYIDNYNFYTNSALIANPGSVDDIMKNTKFDAQTIDLWNAHATGTPIGDITEYNLFSQSIKKDIPIVGYKGYVGHCIAASGLVEMCMLIEDKNNNILRPNIILGDKIIDDDRIITNATSFSYKNILKVSLGFGGKTSLCQVHLF